jgi:hypothetical protein
MEERQEQAPEEGWEAASEAEVTPEAEFVTPTVRTPTPPSPPPPVEDDENPPPRKRRVAGPKGPSVELIGEADHVLIWGIVCVLLGWTVIVPLITLDRYSSASKLAKEEGVPTPTKATIGLIIALLFGIAQVLTVDLPFLARVLK